MSDRLISRNKYTAHATDRDRFSFHFLFTFSLAYHHVDSLELFFCCVLVFPRLTKIPDRSYTTNEGATANVTCEAFGVPSPVIQWTQPLFALPEGRSSVSNGSLSIKDFRSEDTGTYMCTATNKLGSTSTLTALGIHALEAGKLPT